MLVQPLEELYNYLLGNRLHINGYPQEGQNFALSEMIFPHPDRKLKPYYISLCYLINDNISPLVSISFESKLKALSNRAKIESPMREKPS